MKPSRLRTESDLPEVEIPQTLTEAETLTRAIVQNRIEREELVARRDQMIEEITRGQSEKISKLDNLCKSSLVSLKTWAQANRREFGTDRSLMLAGHRVGWRLGNHRTATKKGFTWAKVLVAIKDLGGEALAWLRIKEEVDKEAMIASRSSQPELLAKIGVLIVQDETFGITPNREGQEGPAITE